MRDDILAVINNVVEIVADNHFAQIDILYKILLFQLRLNKITRHVNRHLQRWEIEHGGRYRFIVINPG